ncbi:DNA-binding response regulator [Variovorax sp. EL159]|uniref:response regulator transcription factor n=1 Tax=Variovorax sp. EL159 TaxID=1566270 RepID=UPI00088A1248|nr:DNA-binding response regulator [Variovorax sp. EL159]SCX53688.1 Response regulator receiver domain-containing protein [Variovorax sp. EL159]
MSYWSSTPTKRAHILLIDDNIDELQVLLGTLRGADHRISFAFDAMQGYRRATALLPDLILLDVRMGAIDGYATCRLLKADRATARIPVIFVTASGSVEERLTGLREGAVDYILKPYEATEVLARVAIHLSLADSKRTIDTTDETEVVYVDAEGADAGSAGRDKADRVIAQAAERVLLSNLSRAPSLAEIAVRVGTHEKRLSRAFRERTGQSVFEFLREARLQQAQRLLLSSALSIDEVAVEVGFSGAANFSTAFRERFDATPAAFRNARFRVAETDAAPRA